MSFIEDYQKLVNKLPKPALYGGRNEEVNYCDYIFHSYNTYYSFDGGRLKDCAYMYNSTSGKGTFTIDCFDCDHSSTSERCYECFAASNCYNSSYLEYCLRLTDCHYCIHCRNSSNLFGCAELQYKNYCIFNVQYTKDEYQRKIKELFKRPAEQNLVDLEKLRYTLPQPSMRVTRKSENSFGDYIIDSKNCYFGFYAAQCQDSAYLFDSQSSRDCFDGFLLHECELCYECTNLGHSYNCSFVNGDFLRDCHFCTNCYNSQNLFGCVNLRHAKFCILNKQYTEKDYWKIVKQIREELDWL
jgi:hypothetical protein